MQLNKKTVFMLFKCIMKLKRLKQFLEMMNITAFEGILTFFLYKRN